MMVGNLAVHAVMGDEIRTILFEFMMKQGC